MFTWQRPGLDLNGTWKFCPDPMQRCRRQQWWKNPTKANEKFPCWDRDGLWDIQVPGTWKTQFEELKWYDGHATYMLEFSADDIPADHEAFLCFDGIVYAAEVFLNGQFLSRREWGYSAFQVNVTDLLLANNQLWVLVDNRLDAERVPGEIFDWNNDGGIIGAVKLIFVPRRHLRNFRVETKLDGAEALVTVNVELGARDEAASLPVTVRFPELGIEQQVTAVVGDMRTTGFRIPRDRVELWHPENPKLYRIELATEFETVSDEVGLREIRTEGHGILLNGEPLRLYGVCVHAEFPETGRTATEAGVQRMIDEAKALGLNFLRCAHYPYAEIFGRMLDRAGLLWWEEVPAYWLRNMDLPGQTRKACGMMAETVRRDWNRASLIFWSVSNECCYRNPDNHDDNNYSYWFTVVPMVRALDPSRLISCAEAGNMVSVSPVWDPAQGDVFERDLAEVDRWRPGHAEAWYQLFDVLAANLYRPHPGEAELAYPRLVEMLRPYGKPIMLSEFGSMSKRGAKVPADRLGGETRHAALLREAFATFHDLPELVGYCPWCLNDIRVPIHWRWYNDGKGVFRYGFLDDKWRRKETVWQAFRDCLDELKATWQDD